MLLVDQTQNVKKRGSYEATSVHCVSSRLSIIYLPMLLYCCLSALMLLLFVTE